MTPYKPGDRVVVRIPEPFVGVVHCLTIDGAVIVEAAGTTWTLAASGVRPAMPRDRHDLDRWGLWWWLEDRVVLVDGVDKHGHIALFQAGSGAIHSFSPVHNWRGPVARPPEVRS